MACTSDDDKAASLLTPMDPALAQWFQSGTALEGAQWCGCQSVNSTVRNAVAATFCCFQQPSPRTHKALWSMSPSAIVYHALIKMIAYESSDALAMSPMFI